MNLLYRKAKLGDLKELVSLLIQDKLGKNREQIGDVLDQKYIEAFKKIDKDRNQYLMVVCQENKIIGTCQLTLIPSLTFIGSTRMQIEGVRIHSDTRGQSLGRQMIEFAIDWGKNQGASIIQLTTNKERLDALAFYEHLGFETTHEGMKLYLK